MTKKIINILVFSFIALSNTYTQGLVTDINYNDLLLEEFNSIYNREVSTKLFYSPFVESENSNENIYNLFENNDYGNYLICEPVFALRNSSNGFNMYSDSELSNSSVTWITPGIELKSSVPLLNSFSNIWIYSWSKFYKHSAYGFNKNDTFIENINPLFYYNYKYSVNFYTPTKEPSYGIDFDEGQGGISLLSPGFEFILGKFKTNIGPFYIGNLSISRNAPSFPQFIIKAKYKKKVFFSYLIGSLNSNLAKNYNGNSVSVDDLYVDEWLMSDSDFYPWYNDYLLNINNPPSANMIYERYVVNHRFDFLINKSIRIGLYEQIIFGAKQPSLSYLIPLTPFWSNQHSGNDVDNLQIGLDWDYYFEKQRFYGAILIDEWAPFDTFNDKERNWFACQLGFSRIFKLTSKNALFKVEYSKIDPRTYTHRFIINQPKHNGYNLGYWSENNSDDLYSNFTVFINDRSIFKFEYQYTRFGSKDDRLTMLENQYVNSDVDFLADGYNYLNSISIEYSIKLANGVNFDFNFSEFETSFYENKRYNDLTISMRYNINQ